MSSTKRSYNETISSNSSISTTLNDENDYVVLEQQKAEQEDMDIEEQIQQAEEENLVSRKKRLNTDKDDLFKSNANDHSFQSSIPISSTLNYPSLSNTSSNTPNSIVSTTTFLNNYISPKDSFNNNNNTHDDNSTLKVSEDTKALSPVELLMSSPPISTSTPKTSQTKNTSNSSLTLTTQNSDTWDFNYSDSFTYNTSSNSCDHSSNDNKINNYFSHPANLIRTDLSINSSNGPFSPIYSQIYDNEGIVFAAESFNYLVQLYEFCDNSSTKLQSNITSTLRDLVLLISSQLDGFDIPFIEHHKWNGSHFYGPIDVESLLDQLDDGLGISSAKYVWYSYNNMRTSGSVLQCGYRRTHRRTCRTDENQSSSSSSASSSTSVIWSANNTNGLQDNDLRHAVLNRDAEREAQIFLELLAEEEENEENGEDNGTDQEEESDSFSEISKESDGDDDDDDDDDSLIQGFASTSIRQRTDTFGNPINQTRTTSTRQISRPSADNNGNETDDSLDDYLVESGNLTESTYEEIDFSDIESIATDSTIDDGWHNVSRED